MVQGCLVSVVVVMVVVPLVVHQSLMMRWALVVVPRRLPEP